ncbi:acyltransferase [Sphingobacterium paludis]|uniref:Acetyltransferase-like isoleucine patch superfamily enzyme n=1 Tax=Sphingobacterium paludis TaxID=1476465 RepID=A0A4R7D0N1_9SPHI|nr:acyltransferase [Sphingobacterium paludis]TDS13782.1 acetyltransferase-like isoleucine patch superfamily enzyme [Sphingobacterium paludis]
MTIHSSSDVQTKNVGKDTYVWQFCVILKDAVIGENCNINSHVFIENDVAIGNNVTIKSGVQIWDGVIIQDNVFIGPNVTFTNDLIPRSKHYPKAFEKTVIKKGASVGANATIVAGHTVGDYAFIGAGSVVTKNIPPHHVYYGNPAAHKGYITKEGILLDLKGKTKEGLQFDIQQFK